MATEHSLHTFPSPEHHKDLRRKYRENGGFSALDDNETWFWHAYAYAFHEVLQGSTFSPIDPNRHWFDKGLAIAARDELLKRLHKHRPAFREPKPSDPYLVRPHWRQIPNSDLTTAERALAAAAMDETMRHLHATHPRFVPVIQPLLHSQPAPEIFPDDPDPIL